MASNLASAYTGPDRRRALRYPFDAQIEIEWGSSTISGKVLDISHTGMLVAIPEPLWIGAQFSATILLQTPIIVDCVVRRVEPGRGLGVQMVVTVSDSQPTLDKLIAGLEAR